MSSTFSPLRKSTVPAGTRCPRRLRQISLRSVFEVSELNSRPRNPRDHSINRSASASHRVSGGTASTASTEAVPPRAWLRATAEAAASSATALSPAAPSPGCARDDDGAAPLPPALDCVSWDCKAAIRPEPSALGELSPSPSMAASSDMASEDAALPTSDAPNSASSSDATSC